MMTRQETRKRRMRAPLRKILRVTFFARSMFDKQEVALECGHRVWCSAGATYRARCMKCLAHDDIGHSSAT